MICSAPSRSIYNFSCMVWLIASITGTAQAEPLMPVRPVEPELKIDVAPTDRRSKVQRLAPQDKKADHTELTDEDLINNPRLAFMVLNQAMLSEDWDVLRRIMRFYPHMAGADPILRDYVQGALYRHEGNYPQAIALYKQIIDQQPDLDYVRLELAIMQFENKQYKAATDDFRQARAGQMETAAHQNAQRYQQALLLQRQWRFKVATGLMHSDNVNSANEDEFLYLPLAIQGGGTFWLPFAKGADNLPKSSWGWRYGASAQVERNISGNHFYTFDANADGISYFSHHDYDDLSMNLAAGYKYQDRNSWFAVTPQLNKTLLGHQSYSHNLGVGLEYGYLLPKWQLMASYMWLKRNYDNKSYTGYDGHLNALSGTVIRTWHPNLLTYASVGWQQEITQTEEYTSRMPWVQVGAIASYKQLVSARISARYGKKRFQGPYRLFLNQKRHDKEWRFNASVWKPGLSFWGVEPKLEWNYTKVNSNLAMYSRNRREISLMLEKRF